MLYLLGNCRVIWVSSSASAGVFADDAEALGIDVTVVKSANIFSDIRKVKKIITENYDIVHSRRKS